jgi:hypothetical protein
MVVYRRNTVAYYCRISTWTKARREKTDITQSPNIDRSWIVFFVNEERPSQFLRIPDQLSFYGSKSVIFSSGESCPLTLEPRDKIGLEHDGRASNKKGLLFSGEIGACWSVNLSGYHKGRTRSV